MRRITFPKVTIILLYLFLAMIVLGFSTGGLIALNGGTSLQKESVLKLNIFENQFFELIGEDKSKSGVDITRSNRDGASLIISYPISGDNSSYGVNYSELRKLGFHVGSSKNRYCRGGEEIRFRASYEDMRNVLYWKYPVDECLP